MHLTPTSSSRKIAEILILVASVVISAVLVIYIFRQLPSEKSSLGVDWRGIWSALRQDPVLFGNGQALGGMFTPPWGVLLLWPLRFLEFKDSWGLIGFITLVALIMSVPRLPTGKPDVWGIVLLTLSFPTLRNLADGNLEGLVIGGLTLIILGYRWVSPLAVAAGLLLATIKFQETWLLCLAVAYLVWRKWPRPQQLTLIGAVLAVVVVSMLLWGRDWVTAMVTRSTSATGPGAGTLIDITLSAALGRLGLPTVVIGIAWALLLGLTLWCLARQKQTPTLTWPYVTILTAASMLLAPYVSGNSFLTIVAIGMIPLLQEKRFFGLVLIALINVPFFVPVKILQQYQSYYWTVLLLLMWGIAAYKTSQVSEDL